MFDLRLRLLVLALFAFFLRGCVDPSPELPESDAGLDLLASDGETEVDTEISPPKPEVVLPRASIAPHELALVVNEDDPQSLAVASYYRSKREIPEQNMIRVKLAVTSSPLTPEQFKPLKAAVDAAAGPEIQALALTWSRPFRVGCMSITSAFALGYDPKYCNDAQVSGQSCAPTVEVAYHAAESTRPFTDFGIRPTMMLAGVSDKEVFEVIDRGLAAEGTLPPGKGFLVRTTDSARSDPRYMGFQTTLQQLDHPGGIELEYIDNSAGAPADDVIVDEEDVLFYFTGLKVVDKIDTNTYRPGAVADHLTSFGGVIKDAGLGGQMSVLRWLEAGVTGSYGTVVEPCSFPQKFPDTRILLPYYFRGNTLVEAYWKSVACPGEGIFVGDPLARPWGTEVSYDATTRTLKIRTTILKPHETYILQGRNRSTGAYETVLDKIVIDTYRLEEVTISPVEHDAYRLELVQ